MGTVSPFTIFDYTSGLISSKNFVSFQLYTQISSGKSNRTINLCRLKHLSGVKLLNVVTYWNLSKKKERWIGNTYIYNIYTRKLLPGGTTIKSRGKTKKVVLAN